MVWTEIHNHLVIRDVGQEEGGGGCAQLNDEQLCTVVEQDLLFPQVLLMAEEAHHRQKGDKVVAVDDDDDGSSSPNAKSPVHHRSPSSNDSGVSTVRNSSEIHAHSSSKAARAFNKREPSPRQAR